MLIALFGILFASIAVFFTENAREVQLRIDGVKAQYLAQAGVMRSLQDWMISSSSTLSRRYVPLDVTVTGNQIFKTGCQANFAYFSFNGPPQSAEWQTVGGKVRLRKWAITNIHSSSGPPLDLTPTKVKVTWVSGILTSLSRISLNGVEVLSSGSYANGQEQALTTFVTLSPGDSFSGLNTYLEWNDADLPPCAMVKVQWTFSDDSATKDSKTHEVVHWNGDTANDGRPAEESFCITSGGQVAQSGGRAFKVLKTVKAVISQGASSDVQITDWDRVEKNIP